MPQPVSVTSILTTMEGSGAVESSAWSILCKTSLDAERQSSTGLPPAATAGRISLVDIETVPPSGVNLQALLKKQNMKT